LPDRGGFIATIRSSSLTRSSGLVSIRVRSAGISSSSSTREPPLSSSYTYAGASRPAARWASSSSSMPQLMLSIETSRPEISSRMRAECSSSSCAKCASKNRATSAGPEPMPR
jgi:hypothetical protein